MFITRRLFGQNQVVHPSVKALYQYFATNSVEPLPSQLAALLGVTQQRLKNWEGRGVSKEGRLAIQQEYGIDAGALESGSIILTSNAKDIGNTVKIHSQNVVPLTGSKRVPLISWVQAGSWADIQDQFHPGEADEWITPVNSKPNGRAYALRVIGDSMTNPNPGGHSFPEGTVIVIDPDMGYDAGNFVIAKDVQSQKATFKQLTTDGGSWFLKPINPIYPVIEIDDPAIWVIGRVCEFIPPGGKL